jgi:DNA-binding response OmpR family regulator
LTAAAAPPKASVLLVSEDDDIADPMVELLRRAGYGVSALDGRGGVEALLGGPPDILILDRDLSPETYRRALDTLAPHAGRASFPLVVLGGGTETAPRGWHEDAFAAVGRPPQPGEMLATLAALRRIGFYRRYRDLVHDLSQPVTTLHALSRGLAKIQVADEGSRRTLDGLVQEAERLMTLLEKFQRSATS